MSNLCIIPARGGSKRISRKNIKDFLGKPIIAYSIEAAINSKLFNEVMVSTDDSEIAKIALKYGAKIPFMRSKKTSDDYSTTFEVIEEVVLKYKEENKFFKYTCCIYPCSPLINIDYLKLGLNHLINNKFDSVLPIIPFSYPIQRAFKLNDLKINYLYPEFIKTRTQDLEKSFCDAGQFYWINIDVCLNNKEIISENSGSIELSELEAQDIDSEVDWRIAEIKYKIMYDDNRTI